MRILYRLLIRAYFLPIEAMRRLERHTNGLENEARFHKKYGKGSNCMIKDCACKEEE